MNGQGHLNLWHSWSVETHTAVTQIQDDMEHELTSLYDFSGTWIVSVLGVDAPITSCIPTSYSFLEELIA